MLGLCLVLLNMFQPVEVEAQNPVDILHYGPDAYILGNLHVVGDATASAYFGNVGGAIITDASDDFEQDDLDSIIKYLFDNSGASGLQAADLSKFASEYISFTDGFDLDLSGLGSGFVTTDNSGVISVDTATYLTTVDISDDTNLTAGTGISIVNDTISSTVVDTNTQLTQAQVRDYAGGMFSGNTETRITATYQTSDDTVDLVVDPLLSNYTNDVGWITDGNTNWNNSYGFITGNQTITLSGDVTGSGATSITTTVVNDSHTHDLRYYTETEIDAFNFLQSSDITDLFNKTTDDLQDISDGSMLANQIATSDGTSLVGDANFTFNGSSFVRGSFGNAVHSQIFPPVSTATIGGTDAGNNEAIWIRPESQPSLLGSYGPGIAWNSFNQATTLSRRQLSLSPVQTGSSGTNLGLSVLLSPSATWVEALRVTHLGDFGINETSPQSKLHVVGPDGDGEGTPSVVADTVAIFQNNNISSDNSYLQLISGSAGITGFIFGDNSDASRGAITFDNVDDSMDIRTGNNVRAMTIDSSQNVDMTANLTVDGLIDGNAVENTTVTNGSLKLPTVNLLYDYATALPISTFTNDSGYATTLSDLTPGTADGYIDMAGNSLRGINDIRGQSSVMALFDSGGNNLITLSNAVMQVGDTVNLNLSDNDIEDGNIGEFKVIKFIPNEAANEAALLSSLPTNGMALWKPSGGSIAYLATEYNAGQLWKQELIAYSNINPNHDYLLAIDDGQGDTWLVRGHRP